MTAVVPLWMPVAAALGSMVGALGSQFLLHYFTAGREKKLQIKSWHQSAHTSAAS